MTQYHFTLSEELKQRMVQKIIYDPEDRTIIIIYKRKSIRIYTYPKYPEKTMKILDDQVKGIMTEETKELTKLNISDQWHKYILSFNDSSESNKTGSDDGEKKKNKSELVLEACRPHLVKLFVDEYQTPHSATLIEDHLEILSLNSKRFKNWISRILYKEHKIVVDSSTLKDCIGVLCAEALFNSGEPIKLNLRVAQRIESNNHVHSMSPLKSI